MAPTCPKGQCNPYTAPIAAVFDHLTSGSYAIDGTIQAYTGDLASNTYGPGNPKGFKAVASDSQVVLSWPATVGASSYSLAFSTARSFPAQTKAVCAAGIQLGAATTYIHTGLQNGITYKYRLCVSDSNGDLNTGLRISATPMVSGSKPSKAKDDCLTYKQASAQPFNFGVYGNYRGAGTCGSADYLSYDGHPGYDYVFPYGQAIFASIAGAVTYAAGYTNPQNYHVLAIAPATSSEYLVVHLHLSSYYCTSVKLPDCPQINVVMQRVKTGKTVTFQPCVAPDKITPCPSEGAVVNQGDFIGYVGDYLNGWGGVSAHLHFEVQTDNLTGAATRPDNLTLWFPTDPYMWLGSGPDPYPLLTNVPLWQQAPPGH
jgi:hypothetical protein